MRKMFALIAMAFLVLAFSFTVQAGEAPEGMQVIRCPEQGFATLADSTFSWDYSDGQGVTIYTENQGTIPYVIVYLAEDLIGEPFDYIKEQYTPYMKQKYGDALIDYKEEEHYSVGGKELPAGIYTYLVQNIPVTYIRVYDSTGWRTAAYSVKYIEGNGDVPLAAFETAVKYFTQDPDADFSGAGEDITTPPDTGTGVPDVTFSEWTVVGTTDYGSEIWRRDVHVSDGGSYLLTSRQISKGSRYYFTFDVIYNGEGHQTVYTRDFDSETIENGKLFKIESMDECGLEIDQIISGNIFLTESGRNNFILLYRQNGGEEDGAIRTIPVMNGRREIDTEYYKGMSSIDLLGVLKFPKEDTSALVLNANVIQRDSTSYVIQQAFTSDEPDGIALFSYTQSNGNNVCTIQVIFDGLGVFRCYDNAKEESAIRTGNFEVLGYNYHYTEANFP